MAKTLYLKKTIPSQVINEGASFLLNLLDYIETSPEGGKAYFRAELSDGKALPQGLICTTEGIITGIPATNTQGSYSLKIIVVNDEAEELTTDVELTINARLTMNEGNQLYKKLKAEVWEALGKNLPLPDMKAFLDRPVTALEIYYLLERFATLTIWDVYNLDYPGEKKMLTLEGCSPHYFIYDRGCCLVATPKNLFSHERNLEDALQTTRAMAREVYKRGWVIEFAGFDKMISAAWVELQHLADKHGKTLEILHHIPSAHQVEIYERESINQGVTPGSSIER